MKKISTQQFHRYSSLNNSARENSVAVEGDQTHLTVLPEVPARPSSARRVVNLRALISEFAARNMGYCGVALFLNCSESTARNYVHELIDHRVIAYPRIRAQASCVDRTVYSLNPDPLIVRQFFETLVVSESRRRHSVSAGRYGGPGPVWSKNARHVHILWDDVAIVDSAQSAPVQRDPLVAALFGAPRLQKN